MSREVGVVRARLRWAVLALLFGSTVLNYVDRQTLSILAPQVQRDLGMTDIDYAWVVQLFLIAYTLAYLGVGWLTDRLGTRLALAVFVAWWSVANMLTGFVQTASQLGIARAALGLGEAGNYTAAPKAVGDHFPAEERGFAIGVYTAGAMVGATIAPPLIAWLALSYGWRAAFVVTGAAGLVWLVVWLTVYQSPAPVGPMTPKEPTPWREIARERPIRGLALARLVADPVWYFYLFWFPKYLIDDRGLTLLEVAQIAWVVYLAADLGSVGGGLLSGRLVRAGRTPARSRIMAMAVAAAIAPLGAVIALRLGLAPTMVFASAVSFAHLIFLVNLTALVVDIYPQRIVATVFGLIAAGSGLGGIISTGIVGRMVTTHSYSNVFLLMALLHPIAWLIAVWSLRNVGRSSLRMDQRGLNPGS